MNDEEFGLIARLVCKQDGIEINVIGEVLWKIFAKLYDTNKDEWREETQ